MFPHGLTFEPARTPEGARQIWKISGDADFAQTTGPAEPSRFRMDRDPNGIRIRFGVTREVNHLAYLQ
jgi:hypothetical protein